MPLSCTITVGNVSIPVPKVAYTTADVPPAAEVARRALGELPSVSSPAALWASILALVAGSYGGYSLRIWGAGGAAAVGGSTSASSSSSTGAASPSAATSSSAPTADAAAAAATAASPSSSSVSAAASRQHRVALLRRVCQRSGVQLLSRTFDWASPAPIVPEDVLGLFPVVKSCCPPSLFSDAEELHAAGRIATASGDLKTGYERVQEAVSLLYNVGGGPLHVDVAHACTTLATIFFNAGDAASAVQQQARAVALFERLCGPDAVETGVAHGALGTYYSALGAAPAAVRHLTRSVILLQLGAPPTHPEVANAYMKLGNALRDIHHVSGAIRCLNEALQRSRWDAPTAGAALQVREGRGAGHGRILTFSAADSNEFTVAVYVN